ncbi:pyridoxal phosphate-dependent aminotransferase [Streptomyces sp. NPDC101175]|uniref:pyridoxal phosphate-dependent aminotransferase n=1 Tax=Streptomyces sp. NPDC101175 TaxID=3366123 RepID=UPI003837C128
MEQVMQSDVATTSAPAKSQDSTADINQPGHSRSRRRISDRVATIAESATLAVDAKAKALKHAGHPVITFGSGEPDFPTPAHVVEAAAAACSDPRYHRYSASNGLPELREAVAAKTLRDSGYHVDASQVIVTNGGKQAIYEAFATLLNPGDEVIVPAPYWPTYPEAIRLAGAIPVPVFADESTGYHVTVDQLQRAWTKNTTMLVFSSPANPTGAVYDKEEIRGIGTWAADNDLWVISDEIYEHMVYGGAEFHSLPAITPALRERCVVVNGVAKSYAMPGWRVGWAIAPPDVVSAMTRLQSHATSNVCNIAQAATLAAVSGSLHTVSAMRAAFDRRRHTIVRMLNEIDGVNCPEPAGAFYVYASVKDLLGRRIRGQRASTSIDLAALLLDEAEVAVVPGEAFGTPGYLRLSYALHDDDLVEGVCRIQRLLTDAAE